MKKRNRFAAAALAALLLAGSAPSALALDATADVSAVWV